MAVEKIQATDSLNDGRVKLNAAIEQSNEAITKATTADENASQAVTTANSVQEQFNQVVIEGDSSVEAAQARVSSTGTTYTTLKERLDQEHESVTTQLAEITPIKPNGVDDTATLQALNGKYAELSEGTFLVSSVLVFGKNTKILGAGVEKTIIKLKDGSNGAVMRLSGAENGLFSNFSLDGNKDFNSATGETGVLEIESGTGQNWHLSVFRILIKNGANHGLSLLGNVAEGVFNWVYHLDNFFVRDCNGYGMYDKTSDNAYSNFYITSCNKADMYLNSFNNMYINFKTDWGGGESSSDIDGANIIMQECERVQFSNLDCQSSYHTGIKMFNCIQSRIDGTIDSNGWNTNQQGIGIYMKGCMDIQGTVQFGNAVSPKNQTRHLIIDQSCEDISLISDTTDDSGIQNNGKNSKVASINALNVIDDFIKTFSESVDVSKGFAEAFNIGIVPNKLQCWLDGEDFKNNPQTSVITDRSGRGHNGTAIGFLYTTESGSDGANGIVFDTNSMIEVPQIFKEKNNYSLFIKLKFNELANIEGYNIFMQGSHTNGRVWLVLNAEKKLIFNISTPDDKFWINTNFLPIVGQTYIIGITIDRNEYCKVYVNGSIMGQLFIKDIINDISYETANLRINDNNTYYARSKFTMYKFLVYQRVLSSREVARNFNYLQ